MLIVGGFGFSVLRYGLWEIDLIIRRTLVYSVLTLTLALLYFGSVALFEQLVRPITGQRPSQFVTMLSTLAIAALFSPLRGAIQHGIDRRFYRRTYDAEQTMATLRASIQSETDLERLLQRVMAVVQESLQPVQMNVWLVAAEKERGADNEIHAGLPSQQKPEKWLPYTS